MVSGFISRIVILVFGTLYPAYASYKAVRTKNVKEYVKWMMYWIVFALFTCAETFTDLFLSFWFPFYYEIKIITVIYLLSPATKGSSILYRKFVHPVLAKREQEIDEYIAKAKEQGYHTMLNLGSKGVNYATSLIMQTAIKSGGGLVNQLKKSYSLNDLSGDQNLRKTNGDSPDLTDSHYREDSRLIRRSVTHGSHSSTSSPSQTGFFYPDADLNQRPSDECFRQIPSPEGINSVNSGWEPCHAIQESKGCNLVRTASLGPSSRTRTRVIASKQGLPKRSQLSEGGSSWSAMEPHEGQNEADSNFNFPLGRSESYPFVFPPLQQFSFPEYQHMFGNLTQNQIFAFVNHPLYSQFLGSNKPVDFGNGDTGVFETIKSVNCDSLEVVITEDNSDATKNQTAEEKTKILEVSALSANSGRNNEPKNNNEREGEIAMYKTEKKEGIETTVAMKENKIEKEVQDQNSEVTFSNESLDAKDKFLYERSGKYNKKPAPTPPIEECNSKAIISTAEEEETGFFTPNASPNPRRKNLSSGEENSANNEKLEKPHDGNLLEVPKKFKSKSKKADFNIQKKLHMPKMSFSFWHQKGGKQPSASETSSVASVETPSTNSDGKNDLEYFIPLRDDSNRSEGNGTAEDCKQ